MDVTIRRVADEAAVRPILASRVLGGKGDRCPPGVCHRILDTARRLSYRPDAASADSREPCGTVLLVTAPEEQFGRLPAGFLHGLQDAVGVERLRLVLARLAAGVPPAEALRQARAGTDADGLILNYHYALPEGLREAVAACDLPAIWINTRFDEDAVRPDDHDAARRATQHLLDLGHTDIAYACYSYGCESLEAGHYSAVDRQAGYASAMRNAGFEPRVVRGRRGHVPSTTRELHSMLLLNEADRPTAVVCNGESVVCPVIVAAAGLGLIVPEALSVVGIGDFPIRTPGLAVATMVLPHRHLGRLAVERLMERIEDPSRHVPTEVVPLSFAPGTTTAPPP